MIKWLYILKYKEYFPLIFLTIEAIKYFLVNAKFLTEDLNNYPNDFSTIPNLLMFITSNLTASVDFRAWFPIQLHYSVAMKFWVSHFPSKWLLIKSHSFSLIEWNGIIWLPILQGWNKNPERKKMKILSKTKLWQTHVSRK